MNTRHREFIHALAISLAGISTWLIFTGYLSTKLNVPMV